MNILNDTEPKINLCESLYLFLSDCNWTRTHNHLVHERTLNEHEHLANLWCVFVR